MYICVNVISYILISYKEGNLLKYSVSGYLYISILGIMFSLLVWIN